MAHSVHLQFIIVTLTTTYAPPSENILLYIMDF